MTLVVIEQDSGDPAEGGSERIRGNIQNTGITLRASVQKHNGDDNLTK